MMTIGSQRAIRVLGFAGSLRRGSYNRALLRAASELAPEGMLLDIFDLLPIPLYNGDVEAQGDPMPVSAFKDAIRQADGVPDGDAGIQPWRPRRNEECHRLGVPPAPECGVERKTRSYHGRLAWRDGDRAWPKPAPPSIRIYQFLRDAAARATGLSS